MFTNLAINYEKLKLISKVLCTSATKTITFTTNCKPKQQSG